MSRPVEPSLREDHRPRRIPEQTVGVSTPRVNVRSSSGRTGAAVVKVVGWRKGAAETRSTLDYVLRKADQAVDDWEQPVTSAREVTDTWALSEQDGRSSVHIVFSLPNQDAAKEWLVAREAAQELFGDHPYICALHTDTKHPHVHVIVRARDYHGRKLRIDRANLAHYRETLARCGRARGVRVEARTYKIATRLRNTMRAIVKPEPSGRVLDRACEVLKEPEKATPQQLARSVRDLRKHRDALLTRHRAALVAASSAFEKDPVLQKYARALVKVALSGEHGKRFGKQRERTQALDTLTGKAEREKQAAPEAPDSTPAPSATEREIARAVRRLVAKIDELNHAERKRARDIVAKLAKGEHAKQARKLDKALRATTTDRERLDMMAAAASQRSWESRWPVRTRKEKPAQPPPAESELKRAAKRVIARVGELGDISRERAWEVAKKLAASPEHAALGKKLDKALRATMTQREAIKLLADAPRTRPSRAASPIRRVVASLGRDNIERAGQHLLARIPELDQDARDRLRRRATQLSESPTYKKLGKQLHAALTATKTDHERTRDAINEALVQLEHPANRPGSEIARAVRVLRSHNESLTIGDRERVTAIINPFEQDPALQRHVAALSRLKTPPRSLQQRITHAITSKLPAGRALEKRRQARVAKALKTAVSVIARPYQATVAYHQAARRAADTIIRHGKYLTDEHRLSLACTAAHRSASPGEHERKYGKIIERMLCAQPKGRAYWKRWQRREPYVDRAHLATATRDQVRHVETQLKTWLETATGDRADLVQMTRAVGEGLRSHAEHDAAGRRLCSLADRHRELDRNLAKLDRPCELANAELRDTVRALQRHADLLRPTDRSRIASATREISRHRVQSINSSTLRNLPNRRPVRCRKRDRGR